MMKVQLKEKRWIAMAVMVLIWLLAFPLIASAANTSGYWEYTVSNQKATITAYNGEEAEVVIPEFIDGYRVVEIASYVFRDKVNMTSVTIPQYVESIGYETFSGCESLQEVYFNAENCKDLGSATNTFANAGKYSGGITVTIGDMVKRIPASLFYSYKGEYPKIISLSISDSVESIGASAFEGCNELEDISWGKNIKTIYRYAFKNCTNLKLVELPKTLESMEFGVFNGCEYLESIHFNAESCADFGSANFADAGRYSESVTVTIGESVTKIPTHLFYSNYGEYPRIAAISIPENVKSIGRYAFANCVDLSSITILNDTISIGSDAFQNISANAVFNCYYGSATDTFALGKNYNVEYLPPYTPENLFATGDSTAVTITWDGARGAQGYQLYRKTASAEWEQIYSGTETIYEDKNVIYGQTYYYAVKAYAPGVVSEWCDSVSVYYNGDSSTGGGSTGGGSSTEGSASSGGSSGGSGGGCYVATAVYGSYDCPEVWTLRRYRDYELSQTASGRAFIKTYYAVSPTIVKYFGEEEWFQDMWRGPLDKMVSDLQEKGYEATPYEDIEW